MVNRTFLLDTQILLWWLIDDPKLKKEAKKQISHSNNLVCLSTASFWEIIIKQSRGKLKLKLPLQKLAAAIPFQVMPIKLNHILALEKLPPIHRDPFDRILIAQALEEKAVIITADKKIRQYRVACL